MNKKLILSSSLLILLAGCIGQRQYSPILYYDFGQGKLQNQQLQIDSISIEGPHKERFIYRSENNQLLKDEYNRWAQMPDLLLAHYLKQSFQPGGVYSLNAEIISIEHDLIKEEAHFKVLYSILNNGSTVNEEVFLRSFKTNGSLEDFVEKTSKAVAELTEQITTQLEKRQ